MQHWELILAGMLHLQAPGQTIYSQIETAESPDPVCDEASILCIPPRWSDAHDAFIRAEQKDEGVLRYMTIAAAIATVSEEEHGHMKTERMAQYLTTIAFSESGFRRDVHSGIGAESRGDCRETHGIKHCNSVCLAQINFGASSSKTIEGYDKEDLVGVDYASTRRCFQVAARHVLRSYSLCTTSVKGPLDACVFASYGGSPTLMSDPRIGERVRSLTKLRTGPKAVNGQRLIAFAVPMT